MVGADKSYNSTTYNSKVIYTCPEGDKLKSVCRKDSKWSPVNSACKGNVNSFLFVVTIKVILFYFQVEYLCQGKFG